MRGGEVVLWEAGTSKQIRTIPAAPKHFIFGQAAFLPDGRSVCVTTGNGVGLMETATGRELGFIPALDGGSVWALAVSADGKYIAASKNHVTHAGKPAPGTVVVWDVATKREIAALSGHASAIEMVSFAPDGKHLASSGDDGTVRVWNVTSGTCLATLTGHAGRVNSVAFAPDGGLLASGGADGTVRVWDVTELLKKTPK